MAITFDIRQTIKHAQKLVLDVLFPRRCVGCKDEGTVWCQRCADAFAPGRPRAACPFCGEEGSDRACSACASTHALDGCVSLFPYADPRVRQVLVGWKYHGDPAYAAVIGCWISSHVPSDMAADIVVPIPLHVSRLRSRGFNQAETVSRAAASALSLPHVDILVRARKTAPQAKIEHAKRRAADLAGAFVVKKGDLKVAPADGVPCHVLLCDDVFTTGATMDAAARALKNAGAETVWGFTVAKG